MFIFDLLLDGNTYAGIVIGGIGAIIYFKYTKSQLNWKRKK